MYINIKADMKKYLSILLLYIGLSTSSVAQAKFEKMECDTMTYSFTAILSCPQSKDILYRAAKESLATHIPNFQQKLQYDDKETGTIKFRNSSYLYGTKTFPNNRPTIDMTGFVEYVVTITIKDGKYRVKTEDPMANWQESFIFNDTKQDNGRKRLDLKGFTLWSDYDRKILESYSQDVGKIIADIMDIGKRNRRR